MGDYLASGYGMIYETIFDSSVARDWQALVTFMALIALADGEDNVYTDLDRLQRKTGFPEKVLRAGLVVLLETDDQSKSPAEMGRRITFLPFVGETQEEPTVEKCRGFHIVNRSLYKRLLRKKYNARYAAKRRDATRLAAATKRAGDALHALGEEADRA